MKKIYLFIFILISINLNASISSKKVLSLEAAQKMADSCLILARENNWKMNIAIYESPNSLKFYAAMDGSYPASENIAKLKGKTSAGLPFTTKDLGQRAFEGNRSGAGLITIPGTILIAGGVPIILKDGTHAGGVGVSGDTGDNDERCAKTAINTLLLLE